MTKGSAADLKAHRYAEIIPAISENDYAVLREDIRLHGIVQPILLFEGHILDGRNRYRAAQELKIDCPSENFSGDDKAALMRVLSLNVARRHLTASQRAMIAADVAAMKPGGKGANQHGKAKRSRDPFAEKTLDEAAKAMNVGRATVVRAKALKREASSEIVAKVKAGKETIGGALKKTRAAKQKSPDPTTPIQERIQTAIGAHPEKSNRILAKELGIDEKTVRAFRNKKRAPAISEADAVRMVLDEGKTITEVSKANDISYNTLADAVTLETGLRQGREEAALLKLPETFAPSVRERFDAALRVHQRKLDAQFENRVQSEIQKRLNDYVLPSYSETMADADFITEHRKGVFTQAEFRTLLFCLHPDGTASQDQRNEAFRIFNAHKILLLAEKDFPRKSPGLPKTLAEMMAGKRTRTV